MIGKNKKQKKKFYESKLLKLNSEKAKLRLGWKCILTFRETAKMVSEWYRDYYGKKSIIEKSKKDIFYFEKIMGERL